MITNTVKTRVKLAIRTFDFAMEKSEFSEVNLVRRANNGEWYFSSEIKFIIEIKLMIEIKKKTNKKKYIY